MRYALWILILITVLGCGAPAENVTAIRENALKQGYDSGFDKGYIKGTDDARANIEDIKQNAYKEGYAAGYDNATADIEAFLQENEPGLTVTYPMETSSILPAKFVGDKTTKIYHYPQCSLAVHISKANQVWDNFVKTFVMQGMKPCDICKPPK